MPQILIEIPFNSVDWLPSFVADTPSANRILPLVTTNSLQITARGRVAFNIIPVGQLGKYKLEQQHNQANDNKDQQHAIMDFLSPDFLQSMGQRNTFSESDIEKVMLIYTEWKALWYNLNHTRNPDQLWDYFYSGVLNPLRFRGIVVSECRKSSKYTLILITAAPSFHTCEMEHFHSSVRSLCPNPKLLHIYKFKLDSTECVYVVHSII